jgi:Protein of unknown function (DUF2975)
MEERMDVKPRSVGGRLRTIRTLLSLMLALNVLTLISAAVIKVSGGIVATFDVPVTLVYGPQPYVLQQTNRQLIPDTVNVYVQQPTLTQTVLGLLEHGLAYALATLPMIILARRLVDQAIAGDPFTMSMVRGLRRLGVVVLVGGLCSELVRSAATIALFASAVPGGHPVTDTTTWVSGFSFWWLLLGLVVLGFAQVIEHGCALRAELDGVI